MKMNHVIGVVGIPALHALTHASGGYALLHNSFDKSELEWSKNLSFLLQGTTLASSWNRINSSETHVNRKRIENGSTRMHSCILDLKFSSEISPLQLLGPGDEYPASETMNQPDFVLPFEQTLFAKSATASASHGLPISDPSNLSMLLSLSRNCRVLLGRKDPLSTLSILFEVNDKPVISSCVYIQAICRWVEDNFSFTRVTTARLPVAQNVNTFISSIQPIASAVILAKEAVLRSSTWILGNYHNEELSSEDVIDEVGEEEELTTLARVDLDHTVQRISRAYRLLENTRNAPSSSLSSLTYAFPSNLKPDIFLRLLHHMRRGGMLGAGALLQTAPDDRHSMRDFFLRFPLHSCGKSSYVFIKLFTFCIII